MTDDAVIKLKRLLKQLFQMDNDTKDLDFGIYRIMHMKKDAVEYFVNTEIAEVGDPAQLDISVNSLARDLGIESDCTESTLETVELQNPIKANLFRKKRGLLRCLQTIGEAGRIEVFNDLYRFFSRYYDEGDFIPLPRISSSQTYAIPYNGEEVVLHWANKDQYFIKTGEHFKNFTFDLGEYTVHFRIKDADIEQNNTQNARRYFIPLRGEDLIDWDSVSKTLTIWFEYRSLTTDEDGRLGPKKQQQMVKEAYEAINGYENKQFTGLRDELCKPAKEGSLLERKLKMFVRRNTTDFFIHKNLGGFLSQELDFFIKNEVLQLDGVTVDSDTNLSIYTDRIAVLKELGTTIIDFLAQMENFQKMLWEKKKFVLRTDYNITLDHIPEEFYVDILNSERQLAEWRDLFSIGNSGSEEQALLSAGNIDEAFLRDHPFLVVDTANFDDDDFADDNETFRERLLAKICHPDGNPIEDLDDAINGLMVKSENWQALNLLKERYQEQVKCVYIDPPYNTGNDEFLYKDNYMDSSWLSMMENRLEKAQEILHPSGTIAIHMDEHETANLEALLGRVMGKQNNLGTIIWDKRNPKGDAHGVSTQHEYLFCWCKNSIEFKGNGVPLLRKKPNAELMLERAASIWRNKGNKTLDEINQEFSRWVSRQDFSGGESAYNKIDENGEVFQSVSMAWPNRNRAPDEYFIPLIHPVTERPCPVPERGWRNPPETMQRLFDQNKIIFGSDERTQPRRMYLLKENLYENLPSLIYFGGSDDILFKNLGISFGNTNPKTIKVSKQLIDAFSPDDGIIMDFFAGSGTTAHSVVMLNRENGSARKYILVEMADYMETLIIPRIKKAVFTSEWRDGKPQNTSNSTTDGRSHIMKCIKLESYEDTLNNIEFASGGSVQQRLHELQDYSLRYMLDLESRGSPCRMNRTKLDRPFAYTLVRQTSSKERNTHMPVDLVETFNYLLGIHTLAQWTEMRNGNKYAIIIGEKPGDGGMETHVIIWRTTDGWDAEELTADREFVESILAPIREKRRTIDQIHINGDFTVKGARPIEETFHKIMEGERNAI